MDLNKHLADYDEDQKHFHSNGFARLSRGNNIGSTNMSSYSDRRSLNMNRRVVMAYDRSALANGSYREQHREFLRGGTCLNTSTRPQTNNGRASIIAQSQVRRYNPYA